jgi:hypothetical protein
MQPTIQLLATSGRAATAGGGPDADVTIMATAFAAVRGLSESCNDSQPGRDVASRR